MDSTMANSMHEMCFNWARIGVEKQKQVPNAPRPLRGNIKLSVGNVATMNAILILDI